MKTMISENTTENIVNKTAVDKMAANKRVGTRKFLQTLQPSGGDKENLVGLGRSKENTNDPKISKQQQGKTAEVEMNKFHVAKVNPSLYKKLIIEDLTSTEGPSEKYWEVIAERRRKALVEVLDQNENLRSIISALEEENETCKKLLEQTTDVVNTLKEIMNEEEYSEDCNEEAAENAENDQLSNNADCSTSDSAKSDSEDDSDDTSELKQLINECFA